MGLDLRNTNISNGVGNGTDRKPARTMAEHQRWYNHFTVDLFALILQRSIFHPFIAWLIPLCQRAIGAPGDSIQVLSTTYYAALITALSLLGFLDRKLAYGQPRELDWENEVVVITGGAGGLGKIMAEMYGMRGVSVALLDVREPEWESEGMAGVKFYRCDVGKRADVEKARGQIEKDLGPVTILINNAGIVNGKPLLELSDEDIHRNFNINLLSHFHTLRTFLPSMLASETGGTIVTVASVLGKLGASNLSDYTSAKAGLIAMHNSLLAELKSTSAPAGAQKIRTILVTPGQLSTPLFSGVKTPSSFFGPVVEPVELAREIVRMVDAGESGNISMPLYARWIEWLHVLPSGLQRVARQMAGIDNAMEGFGMHRNAVKLADGVKGEKES
ncbi:hypothetical protein D0867_01677 [Hortaea werneckii]|uniref:Ketoreductase domain-containing protein n=1 Tax=Hortaea werneckii TaxID=91943 RepID=A0A3M7BMT2_HORWE|nr:hypothetical protein D0867_01677 [Hortaea werneckii]RMY41122.1 hypothetical protein D0866_00798 [Hortaea werneckii]